MSRLTRQDMKRDEVREGLTHAVDYARVHGRQLLVGIAVVIVLAAAVGGWFAVRAQRAVEANQALAQALKIAAAPIDAVAPRPDDPTSPSFADEASRDEAARVAFEAVRERFGGQRVASVAAAYLANMASSAGRVEEARELWDEAGRGRQTALTSQALLNRIAADRAAGRGEEVLAELNGWLESGSDAPLPEVVLLDEMAATLEALDRGEEAREIYQRIVDDFPQTAYSRRASQQAQAF